MEQKIEQFFIYLLNYYHLKEKENFLLLVKIKACQRASCQLYLKPEIFSFIIFSENVLMRSESC